MKFKVQYVVTTDLELSDDLVRTCMSKEWRDQFYNLRTPEDVAEHVSFNLLRGADLVLLDGFADRDFDDAKLSEPDWDVEDIYRYTGG